MLIVIAWSQNRDIIVYFYILGGTADITVHVKASNDAKMIKTIVQK
jgi:hypothetical protein